MLCVYGIMLYYSIYIFGRDIKLHKYIQFGKPSLTDLNMYLCGTEKCEPGHSYGPAVRDHFLIHYILSGKGYFKTSGKTYNLKKGDGFLIYPGIVSFYQADHQNPWHYSWVGFNGIKCETYLKQAGLTCDNPIFSYNTDNSLKSCFDQMVNANNITDGRELKYMSLLYNFLFKIIEINKFSSDEKISNNTQEEYLVKAIDFISKNYSNKIRINDIAVYIGIDRSYLYSIFKKYTNISPQQYLINYRISKACELLNDRNLSIGNISRSVGYSDPLLFSKMFKNLKGLSPKYYRKK